MYLRVVKHVGKGMFENRHRSMYGCVEMSLGAVWRPAVYEYGWYLARCSSVDMCVWSTVQECLGIHVLSVTGSVCRMGQ